MPLNFADFFRGLTAKGPYPYQGHVAERLAEGKNVVLRAPTGSGKTWASIAPYVFGERYDHRIADRMLYALPLRSLATSLWLETRDALRTAGLHDVDVRLQTGESRDDPFFEGDLIFTTIDQLLSSYLFNPVSLPAKRVGNINAGVLIGSLVVFDEFHLLEPGRSMDTAIEMLDRLVNGGAPLAQFVLMTATLCSTTVDWLARKLNAEVVSLSESEAAALPSHKGKRRHYRWVGHPLTTTDLIDTHRGGRTIALMNTVDRAQRLFSELLEPQNRSGFSPQTEFALLHSRFLPEHRKVAEDRLAQWFGPDASQSDVVLVTTQVIEAGMDLSCDNLHTELAPMNSIIQRAGRCARRRNQTGTVWIYDLETTDDGKRRFGPYRDMAQLVEATRALLAERPADDMAVLYHDELAWVDRVHAEAERDALKDLDNLNRHRGHVHMAMDGLNPNASRDLVRDIDSVQVVVTAKPEEIRFDRRKWPRAVSVSRAALWALAKPIDAGGSSWVVKAAIEQDVDTRGVFDVGWESLTSGTQLRSVRWMIAVHPDHASYSPTLGLRFGAPGAEIPIEYRDRPAIPRYTYECETYAEHIRRVLLAAGRQEGRYRTAVKALSARYAVSAMDVDRWVSLACALHDVGKLAMEWQDPISRWQNLKDDEAGVPRRTGPLAHSDYNPATDWMRQGGFARPPHAAEGAWAVADILIEVFGPEIWRILFTAIARHHGTWSKELGFFRLIPEAAAEVEATLESFGESASGIALADGPDDMHRGEDFGRDLLHMIASEDAPSWAAYAYVVRRLRLADQASLKEHP